MNHMNRTNRVLLSIGDPNGIGPEIAVAAATAVSPAPVLVGDRHVIADWARHAGLRPREITSPTAPTPGVLDLLAVDALPPDELRPGVVSAEAGAATVAYLDAAVAGLRAGIGDAIVACPHSETAINSAGIPFSGYPGLLATLAEVPADEVFLLLIGGGLHIVHATLHERLADALDRLTPPLVAAAARAAAGFLRTDRIGICGINPHAGEDGLFGDDDLRVTAPSVATLRAEGFTVTGPFGADLLLAPERRSEDIAYVAMYHDQGHIPVKVLAGRNASAVTVGAGLAFSSVGHGAAFDIAGKGVADPSAVISALRLMLGTAAP
ncbi:MAG TPA: 4-hydroxythreonine-4-phosphate dehydrogenase PdxA [Pseudonocardia sp.]|nr:4-hydroxythreonine-4-phosphate dehydrogenase PdxA [Pseudonocardia sp.]